MNVARTCSAEDVRVKLCFLVNVRKARGRNVAGGRRTGSMLAFAAAVVTLKGRMGCTGVPFKISQSAYSKGQKNGAERNLRILEMILFGKACLQSKFSSRTRPR